MHKSLVVKCGAKNVKVYRSFTFEGFGQDQLGKLRELVPPGTWKCSCWESQAPAGFPAAAKPAAEG